jgi:mannose-6-phosphate isomerase-like protein (cupin superfamily)
MIKTVKVSEAPEIPNPQKLDARRLHDTEHAQVMHISLAPGGVVAKHTVTVDVVFFVLEGNGIVEIGDEQVEVSRDTLVYGPANLPRGLVNNGKGPFRVLIIRTPRPKE